MRDKFLLLVTLLLSSMTVGIQGAGAANLPPGFTESLMAGGLSSATAMAVAPDGRLFVAQQGGQLRVIKNGSLLPAPFLSLVVDASGERGLLGVAFDPNFVTNHFVYVYYTATTPSVHNRVSRFTASGDVAVPGSEVVLLDLETLSGATNHNGGAMHFGADGKLYIAVGDNASGANAQTLTNRLGKLLRVNADGSIPPDNPFYTQATGANRAIWVLGLRNPFTFAVQPGTGRTFINDVGQSAWEEINDGGAGANYGWPTTEGYTSDPAFWSPFLAYANDATNCAITGGTFYSPTVPQFPAEYEGWYFFSDYCGGWIRRVHPSNQTVTPFASGISFPVDLQIGADGALYYLARGSGAVFRIAFTGNQAPTITTQTASQQVAVGQQATFAVTASGTSPLAYQWKRNGLDLPGATASSYTLPAATLADNGATFQCVVSNAFGVATSTPATLTVIGNSPPTGIVTSPAAGQLYTAGQTITYQGTASDPKDGPLPASAFTWRVDFHHHTHVHPFLPETSGVTGGSFTIPTTGEISANVWYRIHLTVRDSAGLSHSSYRDILPRTATITLAASHPGLQLTLDGQPQLAPFSVVAVVGMTRTIGTPTHQVIDGKTYQFRSWSDGRAATHAISVPATGATYTATYRQKRR